MSLLNDDIKKEVQSMLAGVEKPVRLHVFTQAFECEYCKETRELVEEVAALSDRLAVEVHDFQQDAELAATMGIDKIPAIAVTGEKDYGIRHFGIPSGYEFGSLIESIKLASSGDSGLAAETRAQLARLKEPVHIQVFITPTWPYCPRAVMLAHQMAVESDMVTADMVEVVEFPHLANKYQVMGVPRTVINEDIQIEGAVPEAMLLAEMSGLLEEEAS